MASENTLYLVSLIEAELDRLDYNGPEDAICDACDDLPDGWVAVRDNTVACYGLASEIHAALVAANGGEPIDPENAFEDGGPDYEVRINTQGKEYGVEIGRIHGDHKGLIAVWEALTDFEEDVPTCHEVWNNFHEFLEITTDNGEFGVIAFRLNAGLRYGFAPISADYLAFGTTHDYSERYADAKEALDAAEAFNAEEKVRERQEV